MPNKNNGLLIAANSGVKIMEIVEKTGKSKVAVTQGLATFKARGSIVFRGNDKTGGYFAKDG